MPRRRRAEKIRLQTQLPSILAGKLKPPLAVALGSPGEVAEVAASLAATDAAGSDTVCYQMDIHQAARLTDALRLANATAEVVSLPDLWDLPARFQTVVYPVALGGERELKLDMVEQAFHVLRPGGIFAVVSPYEKDELFPHALKKTFGKVHAPMSGKNAVLWSQREGDRPRRRHEMTFQVRVDEETSLRFLSRPGTFSYGQFDHGARALTEIMEIAAGDRILDLGCGCGTNGIMAARRAGPGAAVTFVDSNLRAVALAEINARTLGVPQFETIASATLEQIPERAYDVVLANPPYYAQMAIARLFIQCGRRCLKPGGRFYLVTKQVEAVYPLMEEAFGPVDGAECRGYVVFRGVGPAK